MGKNLGAFFLFGTLSDCIYCRANIGLGLETINITPLWKDWSLLEYVSVV